MKLNFSSYHYPGHAPPHPITWGSIPINPQQRPFTISTNREEGGGGGGGSKISVQVFNSLRVILVAIIRIFTSISFLQVWFGARLHTYIREDEQGAGLGFRIGLFPLPSFSTISQQVPIKPLSSHPDPPLRDHIKYYPSRGPPPSPITLFDYTGKFSPWIYLPHP